ncbi:MAG: hypothetical protein Hyperionvirus5_55 [Hyperionvirus sp.]|uniref:Uncharacterized protein n=1 Tax=Hyperionvirus sp. TaxID=2487770 RepID=A0A3G5AD12_9VIRU|nr:MAG: hypothetical protein Hyperionvirus5_55 [Hyperionvirus sp.]
MSDGAIKALFSSYREKNQTAAEEKDVILRLVLRFKSWGILGKINRLIRESLLARQSELEGITFAPVTDDPTAADADDDESVVKRMTHVVYFTGSPFGLCIYTPMYVLRYAETCLFENDRGERYLTLRKSLGYESARPFEDEKELVTELIRLRDFFRNNTKEEIEATTAHAT